MQPSEVQSRWRRLDQNQKVNGLSSHPQPPAPPRGDRSSVTGAAGEEGTGGRGGGRCLERAGGHALDRRRRGSPVRAGRGKRIQGLFLPKKPRKFWEVNPPTAVIAV